MNLKFWGYAWSVPPCGYWICSIPIIQQRRTTDPAFLIFIGQYWELMHNQASFGFYYDTKKVT
jgi:hypothetical protein